MLSPEELMQYTRQLAVESWGVTAQEKIKSSHAFIAGAGGLGSPVLYYLAAAGVGKLSVCDSDRVDITNLNRQILHNHERIGLNKAESAEKTLRSINPSINILPLVEKITARNAQRLLEGADIIIDCLDNFKTRSILNRVSVESSIPLIHAGVAEFRGQVTFLSPPETPCLNCIIPSMPSPKGILPIVGSTAGVIGSIQATEALKYLIGVTPSLKNRLLFWDGVTMEFSTISIKRNPACRVCKSKSQG